MGTPCVIATDVLIFAKLTNMTNSNKFEDLIIWQDAIKLAKEVFTMFENSRNFSIKNQIERAVVSVSANIAEGYELDTNKQFIKHLFIAKASCGEVRSILALARELKHFPDVLIDPLINSASKLSIMIYNFIKSRRG
jgi:four helix bundle protein